MIDFYFPLTILKFDNIGYDLWAMSSVWSLVNDFLMFMNYNYDYKHKLNKVFAGIYGFFPLIGLWYLISYT